MCRKLLCLVIIFNVYIVTEVAAQQKELDLNIYYEVDKSVIDSSVLSNKESLDILESMLDSTSRLRINNIKLNSFTSPTGDVKYNKALAKRRTQSVLSYLTKNDSISRNIIEAQSHGIAWDMLYDLVSESTMPYKESVLEIITKVPEESWRRIKPSDVSMTLVDSRLKHLMDLAGGIPYKYMKENFFPLMRSSQIMTIYYQELVRAIPQTEYVVFEPEQIEYSSLDIEVVRKERKALFALKTNLLYDVATVLNAEIEVPIAERWSVAGEWIFPWWAWDNDNSDSKRHRIQAKIATIEGKYWFGNRELKPKMTGWFAGLYGSYGSFDIERNGKGRQSKDLWSAGLTGGYAHTINRSGSLRMEYSLGLGFMKNTYKEYTAEYQPDQGIWEAYRDATKQTKWFGPTRARVSLVWMIQTKKKERVLWK